jgi:hypothetical protein
MIKSKNHYTDLYWNLPLLGHKTTVIVLQDYYRVNSVRKGLYYKKVTISGNTPPTKEGDPVNRDREGKISSRHSPRNLRDIGIHSL